MEERLEERPTKKVKLGHAAPNGGHVLVPALQMAVVDGGDERDQVRYSGADITEAREVDVNGSDDSVSDDDADGETPRQQIVSAPSLSKNALKKLRNKERWDAGRDARKLKRKQKLAEKRIRKQAAKEEAQATKEAAKRPETPKRPMHTCLPITFIIDCGFDNLMTERERISLGSQLTRSYSDNHKAPFQAYMIVSSWGGQLKERFDTVLEKHHENWRGVTFMEADFVAAGQRAKELMRGTTIGKLAGAFGAGRSANVSLGNSSEHTAEKAADGKLAAKEEDLESGKPPSAVANSEEQEEHVPVEDLASAARQDGGRQGDDRAIEPELPTNEPFEHSTQTTAAELVPSSAVEGPQDGEIIYLTSDSPHTLDRLQPYSSYVVGGLVDKNRHKGICYKTACARGIKTAKLPIGDFLEMQSRFVLATNHVVEIMVRWLECGDWGEAFLKVMPKRKGGVLKAPSASKHDVLAVELGVEDSTPGSTVSREDEAHSKGGDMLETDIHSVPTVS